MQVYTVLPGDTLYGISGQFGVSVDMIKQANGLTSNTINVGQVLQIPTGGSSIIYTVKKGDSLYSIARMYGLDVSTLVNVNKLKNTNLSIGQVLVIPINSSGGGLDYFNYTVKRGDNLYSIANRYNTTVSTIKRLNGLISDLLSIGQVLKIPSSNNMSTPPLDVSSPPNNHVNYTVKRGDSLYSIAKMFNMTVDELMKINNLTSTVLSIGQTLKVVSNQVQVPSVGKECFGEGYKEPVYQTYTVRRGDSLYIIAKKFNTSIDNLISLNNLTSNNLQIGQILKIKEIVE